MNRKAYHLMHGYDARRSLATQPAHPRAVSRSPPTTMSASRIAMSTLSVRLEDEGEGSMSEGGGKRGPRYLTIHQIRSGSTWLSGYPFTSSFGRPTRRISPRQGWKGECRTDQSLPSLSTDFHCSGHRTFTRLPDEGQHRYLLERTYR